jgi:thioredoxin-related protein
MKFFITGLMLLFSLQVLGLADDKRGGTKTIPGPNWKPFSEGFAEAKKSDKKIMLDVFTNWCKWCKKLDTLTYGDQRVITYLNKHYIAIKMNAESGDKVTYKIPTKTSAGSADKPGYKDTTFAQADLAQAFGVTGYPTIIFFDPNGDPITPIASYLTAEQFLPILQYIGEDYYKAMKWDEFQQKVFQKDKAGKK